MSEWGEGRAGTCTAAYTNDCMLVCELTSQCPGGVNGFLGLNNTRRQKTAIPKERRDSLPRMNSQQTPRNLLPHALPLQINSRHPSPLDVRLVHSPLQRESDIEQLARGGGG
jgi:hypothetical protein